MLRFFIFIQGVWSKARPAGGGNAGITNANDEYLAQFNSALFSTETEKLVVILQNVFGTEYVIVILLLIFIAIFWIFLMFYSWNYTRNHPTPPWANKEMKEKNESIRSGLFRIKQFRTMRHRKILRSIWPNGPKSDYLSRRPGSTKNSEIMNSTKS